MKKTCWRANCTVWRHTCVQNSWVEIFNMMDLAINNLTQQNKELKRTVNELGSKVNKVSINYDETVL